MWDGILVGSQKGEREGNLNALTNCSFYIQVYYIVDLVVTLSRICLTIVIIILPLLAPQPILHDEPSTRSRREAVAYIIPAILQVDSRPLP